MATPTQVPECPSRFCWPARSKWAYQEWCFSGQLPALRRADPGYVFPFFHVERDKNTQQLLLNQEQVRLIQESLATGAERGVGELALRHRHFPAFLSEGENNAVDGPIAEQSLSHQDGILKEEWRALFEEFPDRFMFGWS